MLLDFPVTRDGLGDLGDRILIPIVLASVPDEHPSRSFDLLNQLVPFHAISSSPRCFTQGISPLVRS